MATYYKVLGQAATAEQTVTVTNKAISSNVVTLTTSTDHKIIVGQPVTLAEDSQTITITEIESAGDGTAILTTSDTTHRILVGQNIDLASTDTTYSTLLDGITVNVTAVTTTDITVSNATLTTVVAADTAVTGTTADYSDLAFNGTFIVDSDPTSTTFTYTTSSADLASTAATNFTATSIPWELMYTCPTAINTIVSNISICNTTELPARYSIAISDSTNLQNKNIIFWNDVIDSFDTVQITGGYTLDTTTKYLYVGADIANVSISVFGSEVDV